MIFALKEYSLWAKDIVFVIGDGHLDGMQAFLSTYHGMPQSSKPHDFRLSIPLKHYYRPRG